jgi:alpha-beta hydrolase superfamily lysophospholipase
MRRKIPTPDPPAALDRVDGLAYSLWLPAGDPWGALVILHGAGSCKESHHDFARAARDAGMAAVCFDQRGHGESDGALDDRMVEDVATVAGVLGHGVPLALRGSSMGGALAILAAPRVGARAVVAICPASATGLARGVRQDRFDFRADVPALTRLLDGLSVAGTAETLEVPLLLLHAEGDETVPVSHSREIARRAPDARLIAVPGGHHRSVQHDAELQGEALRWLRRRLS